MQVEEKSPLPHGHDECADYLEKLAADVRAGADVREAVANIALVLAADRRDQVCM